MRIVNQVGGNTGKGKRKRLKYFSSGFTFIAKALEKNSDDYEFTYKWAPVGPFEIINNIRMIRGMVRSREMEKYDIVHFGNWETNLSYTKRRKGQLYIAHAHGFYVGVWYERTIVELPAPKRQAAWVQKFFLDSRMKKKLRSADLFYVSTPNMLEPARKEVRKDAIWLPNPIDTSVFSADGKKRKLEGFPSVFLPTRLHAFKNPLYGVKIFNAIRKKYPDAKLHIINYGQGADPLYKEFMRILIDKKAVVTHEKMPKDELAKLYRGADIVLGQFNPLLGNMSLVELEAMACKAPVVTLDIYELNYQLKDLEGIAFKIIRDKVFRESYVEKNYKYIIGTHSEKAVAKKLNEDIKKAMKKLLK